MTVLITIKTVIQLIKYNNNNNDKNNNNNTNNCN